MFMLDSTFTFVLFGAGKITIVLGSDHMGPSSASVEVDLNHSLGPILTASWSHSVGQIPTVCAANQ